MKRQQLKLHSAMGAVLIDAATERGPSVWLTFAEIASAIAAHDLYRRPADNEHAGPEQIAARARQYPALFEQRKAGVRELRLRLLPVSE